MLTMLVGSSAAADPPAGCTTTANVTTCVFAATGAAQTWTVPAGVTSATFDVQGAQGGSSNDGSLGCGGSFATGGNGGEMIGTFAVTPAAVLQVNVGGQGGSCSLGVSSNLGGWNGGGSGGTDTGTFSGTFDGMGGGGASDIRAGSYTLADRIIVGGGGGGAAQTFGTDGGTGGGLSGGDGQSNSGTPGDEVATGGTQTGPGSTGTAPFCPAASPGGLGVGGNGLGAFEGWGGGGGGGGYYGGGGGHGGGASGCTVTGGGGGGSGFIASGATNTSMNPGVRSGDGLVTITYTVPPACTQTGYYRDGNNLTAKQIGGDVTGTLDATGCNIGVYYGPSTSGTVSGANISGANYYGVVDDAASVNISDARSTTSARRSRTAPSTASASSTRR